MFTRSILLTLAFLLVKSGLAVVSTPSSNIRVIAKTCRNIDIQWHRGDGQLCMVTCRKAINNLSPPNDGWYYFEDARYGYGTNLGEDNYCVFIGVDSMVSVRNLDENTEYIFEVFEFDYNPYVYLISNSASIKERTHFFSAIAENKILDSCKTSNSVLLKVHPNASFEVTQYEWKFGSDLYFGPEKIVHLSNSGDNNYTLEMLPAYGCKEQIQKGSLYIIPGADKGIIHSDLAICTGEREYFSAEIQFGLVPKTAFSRTWIFDNDTRVTTSTGHRIHEHSGEYNLKLVVYSLYDGKHAGCSDTFTLNYNVVVGMQVHFDRDTCFQKGSSLRLTAPVVASEYLWDNKITGKLFVIRDTGMHHLKVTDYKGCHAEDDFYVGYCTSVTSTQEIGNSNNLFISQKSGLLVWENKSSSAQELFVYESSGKLIRAEKISAFENGELPLLSGIYMLRNGNNYCTKVLIP